MALAERRGRADASKRRRRGSPSSAAASSRPPGPADCSPSGGPVESGGTQQKNTHTQKNNAHVGGRSVAWKGRHTAQQVGRPSPLVRVFGDPKLGRLLIWILSFR